MQTTEHIDPADPGTPALLAEPRITVHVYDGLEPIEEYTATANPGGPGAGYTVSLAREFLWGAGYPEPVAMVDHTDAGDIPATGTTGGGPEVLHYLRDALGSVMALTATVAGPTGAPAAAWVERYDYDPYGQTYITDVNGAPRATSHYGNPWMWTGQRYDAVTGLYHFTFRTYSPTLGRWLQRDPLGYVDGVNLYEYVQSNALHWRDPLGLKKGCYGDVMAQDIYFSDGEMVRFYPKTIEQLVEQLEARTQRKQVVEIVLRGHGGQGVQELCGEKLHPETGGYWMRIAGLIVPGGQVSLHGCTVGRNYQGLMYTKALATKGQVRVVSYTGFHRQWTIPGFGHLVTEWLGGEPRVVTPAPLGTPVIWDDWTLPTDKEVPLDGEETDEQNTSEPTEPGPEGGSADSGTEGCDRIDAIDDCAG